MILADENVHGFIIKSLREAGFEVLSLLPLLPKKSGSGNYEPGLHWVSLPPFGVASGYRRHGCNL
jgi:hypothetical protein